MPSKINAPLVKTLILIFTLVCLLTLPAIPLVAGSDSTLSGRLVNFKGFVRVAASDREMEPKIGQELRIGDMVQTGIDGWAAILMSDETLIQLNRNTRFILKEVAINAGWHELKGVIPASVKEPGGSVYNIQAGEMWLRNKNKNAVIRIETPTISAGIRGTEFNTSVGGDNSVTMTILEGLVVCRNEFGEVTAGPGERVFAAVGLPPQKTLLITPMDAVQWTLTVPPLDDRYAFPMVSNDIDFLKSEQRRLKDAFEKNPTDSDTLIKLAKISRDLGQLSESETLFNQILNAAPANPGALAGLGWVVMELGNPADALSVFKRIKEPSPLALLGQSVALTKCGRYPESRAVLTEGKNRYPDFLTFYLQEANLEISLRDLSAAMDILQKLQAIKPDYGPTFGVQTVLALTRGESKAALQSALKGTQATPNSPAARVMLSQAHQAVFDLDQALSAAEAAIRINPGYVPALTAKARIQFGSNQTDQAMETIDAALQISPQNSEVLNLRGFLQLARREINAADSSFKSALNIDPGMGEPHLGLALIRMRQGNVPEAMEEISAAVLLEPRRSIFVSYWAKMLYQVKRFDRAIEALDYAAALDPLDPTPLLYKAIILRDLNRPTEAVSTLNQAIQLNDNRAVYRSRFLLDRDLAVKNIDQTIIFQELGLTDWARNKALASVKTDYQNSAGHTFLAGSLLAMGDRLRSGASENLLGMMLQQANLNSLNTFQEYTSFFETPAINGIISGIAGNKETYKGEAIAYGAVPSTNLAFSAIGDYTETDGWRDTNGSRQKGAGVHLKWDPSPSDGLILISSHRKSITWDRTYDPYEYDAPPQPDDRQEYRTQYVTLGYHRSFSPDLDLLMMGKHYNGDFSSFDNMNQWLDKSLGVALFSTSTSDTTIPSDQLQGQLLFRFDQHQFIFGALQHWRKRELDNSTLYERWWLNDGWWYFIDSESYMSFHTLKDQYQSYYFQDIWRITPWLTMEAALYYDVLKNHNIYTKIEQNRDILNPRIAFIFTPTPRDTFRIAGFRYLVPYTIDRLDPTDIGGVPLFRNAYDNSVTEEYDLVWEHEWTTGFVSMNLLYMESEVEENWSDSTSTTWKARTRGIESVWNQILMQGLGGSARYRYLYITNDYTSSKDREDHLAVIRMNYVNPSGLFAGISQTYRREVFRKSDREIEDIWLTDLVFGYKLPNKRGLLRIDVQNLFNHHFNWIVDDMVFDGRVPIRSVSAAISLYF